MSESQAIRGISVTEAEDLTPADWQLLLLADPNRALVERYIERGQCFRSTANGKVAGVAVTLEQGKGVMELMNIAVDPARQGQGVGTALLRHVMNATRDAGYLTMTVGTGNWPVGNLAFYQKAGFRMVRIDHDYFTRHYPEPIIEDGIQCRDRIDLQCDLTAEPIL